MAVRYHEFGGPEVLRWEDAPAPIITADQVLIEVKAAGVSNADLARRSGAHADVKFPASLGMDAAGLIIDIGTQVSGLSIGDRVLANASLPACQAELVAVNAREVFSIPEALSFIHAAAIPLSFLPAYHVLKTVSPIQVGETVAVQGAMSNVGAAAIQLAKHWGAFVIATTSTDGSIELLSALGANVCISSSEFNFSAEVSRISNGKGADKILKCAGGESLWQSLNSLAPGGDLVICETSGGVFPSNFAEALVSRNLRITGVNIESAPWNRELHREALEELIELVSLRVLNPVISAAYKMADVAEAHRQISDPKNVGTVVLLREAS